MLFATGTFPDPTRFNEDFAALHPELLDHLHENGVRLVGVDTPSIDPFPSKDLPAHQAVLRHDLAVLEGLDLAAVPEGLYELIALPLRLVGFDASPVRAILRSLEIMSDDPRMSEPTGNGSPVRQEPETSDRLLDFRDRFPILSRTNYLISNSLGAVPESASASLQAYYEAWATRGVRAWEEAWWSLVADLGDLVAPLIGAAPGEIVFQPNVTLIPCRRLQRLRFPSESESVPDRDRRHALPVDPLPDRSDARRWRLRGVDPFGGRHRRRHRAIGRRDRRADGLGVPLPHPLQVGLRA